MKLRILGTVAAIALLAGSGPSYADVEAAKRWIDSEFQPSTLSQGGAAEGDGMVHQRRQAIRGHGDQRAVGRPIPTHDYESTVLTKAFEEITGIKVNHQELGEGEVVQAVQTQMQTNRNLYDAYINDSDLIGTHSRLQSAVNLTDWMAGEGKDVTNPMLDLDDFIGKSFTTGPDGKLWQLPDQQFANLYWFRKDWFDRPDIKEKFKAKYGYDLGVPVNWSAYEDIADFFTNDVKEIDGVRIYGHMDYGKRAPDLGWRMTDAWLSMAGSTSPGLPNGRPIDEWGIRMEEGSCNPARRLGLARRRHQRSGVGLRHRQVGRVAAQVRSSGRGRPRLLPVAAGARAGQRRPADLLVHGLHCRHGQARRAEGNNTVDDAGQRRSGGWRRRRTAPTGRRA